MRAEDLELDQILSQHPERGELRLRGGRALLTDAAATYRLAEELCDTLGQEGARGVLARYGHQVGYQDATRLRHEPWASDLEWLLAAARTCTITGVGQLEFREVVVDRPAGTFRVEAVARGSYEAAERKDRDGPTDAPQCVRLAGYLSGFGSAFLGDAVLFLETECAARSDDVDTCCFEGKPQGEWGARGKLEAQRYERDAIGERLALADRERLAQAVTIREQELELAAKRRLEQASKLKTEFLANISHELRTPLNSIIGYTDLLLLKLGAKLPPTPKKNLERILANANHLLGLINSILDISKIEAGRMDVQLLPTDLRGLLDEVCGDAQVLLKDKPVELVPEYADGEVPAVLADAVRLKQCLVNVLGNAVKFTQRGSVRVGVRVLKAQREGSVIPYVALSVSDTGPGVPVEHQATIFEPFRQVDASSMREHEGTGLGLPIVRQLLELMGGEIQLKSTPGSGATFTLVLPAVGEEDAPGVPRAEDPAEAGAATPVTGARILLIDDDPDMASILGEMLAASEALADAALETEPDPIRGIARARHQTPDLILLDLKLPIFDGREVLRLLREDDRTAHVPVIVISIRDDLRDTLAEGAVEALEKPVTRGGFLGAVERALGGGR